MFEIKNASVEDIPLIRELTFRVWPQTYAATLSPEQIDYMLELMYSEVSLTRQMTEDGCHFILVFEDGNPVGFASFSETEKGIWKLHKIYVLLNQQGKGTGRFVIEHIIAAIKQQGAVALQLQVNRYNKAKLFYEKLGFRVIKIADFDIGHGYFMNDYVMEKDLTA
jgi:diamine N-acetyltransferase